MSTDVLILRRRDVADLLSLDDCISAVREAFRRHATDAPAPAVLGLHVEGGGFHVKAAALALDRFYFAAKVNGNFPGNAARGGLPTIQGVVVLADAERGSPLAIMDSIEITIQRTAAATAVAAEVLARRNAATAAIVGCGLQGRVQLRALTRVRAIGRAFAIDSDVTAAQRFAKEMSESLGIPIDASHDIPAALAESDICVTCTPSKRAIIMQPDVRPGTFVAGVGADSEEKQELDPALMASSTVVVDVLDQCAAFGDLHHAIAAGAMTREGVHAELGQIVAGRKPGRTRDDDVTVFDSTGMALQDVAAAALVYQRAMKAGRGMRVPLGE